MDQNTPQKPNTPKSPINRWSMVGWAMDLGFIIALPLVAFGLLGKWLDAKLGSDPWLTLMGIALAITSTTIWLTRKFKNMLPK